MRVLVTGAGGFVGAALSRELTAQGNDVVAHVRVEPVAADYQPGSWMQCDLVHAPDPMRGCGPVDTVVHLAGRAHVLREESRDPLTEFRRSNVTATERLARASVAGGARRFVFVSSIGVHGAVLGRGFATETSPMLAMEPYAQSKLEAEEKLQRLAEETGLELVIVRPALVVGPNAPGNLARLRSLVARGLPIPVPMRANQRAFVTLRNLVDLLGRCLEHPAAAGQAFLAAEAEHPSTRQVLGWIGAGMGRSVTTLRTPMLRTGARVLGKRPLYDKVFGDLRVDASKARHILGWPPGQSLESAFRALGRGR